MRRAASRDPRVGMRTGTATRERLACQWQRRCVENRVHYAASKGAIDTLTVGLAREVATEGIRVNAVAPGLIDTDFHAAAGAPERVAALAPSTPMQRAGTPAEVADAIVWLMSTAAAYITGAVLPVGGGR